MNTITRTPTGYTLNVELADATNEFALYVMPGEGIVVPITPEDIEKHQAQQEPEPATSAFVKPSYWNRLCRYLTPGRARPVIMLVGPTGNGKTAVAQQALAACGYSFVELDMNEYVEPLDLIGGMTYTIKDGQGQETFRPGIVTRAFQDGSAIILNEYDAADPRKVMCLQSVFQAPGPDGRGRYVTTPEGVVYPNGDCPLILTANTFGDGPTRQYTGRNALDVAQLDRVSVIRTLYENETSILKAHGHSMSTAMDVVNWAMPIRRKIDENVLRVSLSIRTLLRIAEAMEDGLTLGEACQQEFFERLDSSVSEVL